MHTSIIKQVKRFYNEIRDTNAAIYVNNMMLQVLLYLTLNCFLASALQKAFIF